MKLNKADYINVASTAAALLGLILVLVGCLLFSPVLGIGINLNLSPAVYVGAVLIVAGFIGAILGNLRYNRTQGMNRVAASLALYVVVIAAMIMVMLIAYTIFIPVINPSNG